MVSLGFLLFISGASASAAPHDALNNKLVVGFQGWLMCRRRPPGRGWVHWFAGNKPDAAHFSVELMPDTSELQPDERCPTGLTSVDGPIYLFSDQNPKTVLRQFQWMRQYDIDVAALQRFVVGFDPIHPWRARCFGSRAQQRASRRRRDRSGIYVMYDIAEPIQSVGRTCWSTIGKDCSHRG